MRNYALAIDDILFSLGCKAIVNNDNKIVLFYNDEKEYKNKRTENL